MAACGPSPQPNAPTPCRRAVESGAVSTSPESATARDRGPARWALAAFIVTFTVTRIVTSVLRLRGDGTSGGLLVGGVHIHHMLWGLILLGLVAVSWLARPGRPSPARW